MDGFWSLTDNGIFQIDGTTVNYSLRQHQTLATVAGSLIGFSTSLVNFSFSAVYPIVAIYAPDRPVTMLQCVSSGANSWTAQFWSSGGQTQFEVFVFDRTDNIGDSSNVGLKVYNEQGQLIASAAVPMLRPIAFIQGQAGGFSMEWQGSGPWPRGFVNDYSQAGYAKVAVGCITTGTSVERTGNNDGYMSASGWTCNGGSVQMHWTDNVFGSPSGSYPSTYVGYGSNLTFSGLLIDVSNIP